MREPLRAFLTEATSEGGAGWAEVSTSLVFEELSTLFSAGFLKRLTAALSPTVFGAVILLEAVLRPRLALLLPLEEAFAEETDVDLLFLGLRAFVAALAAPLAPYSLCGDA